MACSCAHLGWTINNINKAGLQSLTNGRQENSKANEVPTSAQKAGQQIVGTGQYGRA